MRHNIDFYPEEPDLRTASILECDEIEPQCGFKIGPCTGCGKCEPKVEE